jgi:pimeloyl-ACP methyl ester carboxylesterase
MPLVPGAVRIHYADIPATAPAQKPPVVLIQGLGLPGAFWFDAPKSLTERGHRVIVMDNRGTGDSDRPQPPYSLTEMADDVARALDHAGIDQAFVCGISMGGMISQHFALRHTQRVLGLVLLCTTPGLPHATIPGPRAVGRLLSLPVRPKESAARSLSRMLLAKERWAEASTLLAPWREQMAISTPTPATFVGHFTAAARHYTGSRLRGLRVPVHVVTGDGDGLIPPKNSATLARLLPDASLEVLQGGGHALLSTHPDVVARGIERLLQRRSQARGA